MPVTDETKDFLGDAKEGKPRKFVMLVTGTTITSLVVYKKGNAKNLVAQAKKNEDGKGFYGLITGRGVNLNFELAIDDGFKKPPVKDIVLKKFLEDEAKFKCMPVITIVQSAGFAIDPENELHARFLKLQTAALEACDKNPGEAPKIGELCTEIGGLLNDDQNDPATAKIAELEKLLADLSQGASTGTTTATATGTGTVTGTATATAADPQRETYETLRRKLEPLLLAAKKADPDKATALANVWNYAEAQAEAKNYPNANKALAGLAEAVKKTLAAPGKTDAEKLGIKAGLVAERRAELEAYIARQVTASRVASSISLDRVAGAIVDQVPEEEEEEDEIGELLQEAVDELYDDAYDELFASVRQDPPEKIMAALDGWRKRIEGNDLVKHLRTSKKSLGVETSVDTDFARLFSVFEERVKELSA